MLLYEWNGPEVGLYGNLCCAQSFSIDAFNLDEKTGHIELSGKIGAIDYIEHGIEFEDPWEAKANILAKPIELYVRRVDDETAFWRDPNTGETLFTANDGINDGMKNFIRARIKDFLEGNLISKAKKYSGKIEKYRGACVCSELKESSQKNPFRWRERTGGNFPEKCFQCSCQKMWWNIDPQESIWIPVADRNAWNMLLEYNGVERKKFGILEGKVYLLQTIRDMGYIPIG